MLDSSIGTTILNGLFGMNGNSRILFNGDVYLGLLTELPDVNGANFSEPSDSSYLRIKIDTKSRITDTNFIGHAHNNINDEDPIISACVENQALIMFPEFINQCTIRGFGLFRSNDVGSGNPPFLWGEVYNSDGDLGVVINEAEVPVIRAGGFKVSLK